MKKGIVEILQTEMLDFTAPVLINNIPSIDGLLCSQRQVIWGMTKAGMTSDKQFYKMLKVSGRIFDYYILGDMPLCGVMKNMGNNYILHKYLMPKGSFGNKNLRDGTGSAPRYIECKLDKYSECMLEGINKNAVTMKKNYDATELEPVLLPSKIPNILVNLRMSIAVSEANKMPSHNLEDVCNSIQHYIKTKDIDKAIELLKVPDLPSGGAIIYDKNTFNTIYKTGKGSFTNLGKYKYDETNNTLTIYEIPYSTYIENIEEELESNIDKFAKELNDYHNGSDKDGLKLELYLKKNANVKTVIQKLRKYTSFESKFSCNFTILDLDGKTPLLMPIQDIYDKWILHRINCIRNEVNFDINKNKEELNRLYGLKIINDELDKAIQIIRNAKTEKLAAKDLIEYFNLNEKQSEYISTIRLININQEWINNRISSISKLEMENKRLTTYCNSEKLIKETIISQLEEVKKKFAKPRLTEIITNDNIEDISKLDTITNYNTKIIFTEQNYIKKIPLTSLRGKGADEQKLKDGDKITQEVDSSNKSSILLFTNKANRYKLNAYDIEDAKPSTLGSYIPNLIDLEPNEKVIKIVSLEDESKSKGFILSVYSSGKISKVDINSFISANKKLQNCYSTESELLDIEYIEKDVDVLMISCEGKGIIVNSEDIGSKASRNSQGNIAMNLGETEGNKVISCMIKPNQSLSFTLNTEKGKSKEFRLDDVPPNAKENETRTLSKYLFSKARNQGNFLINCRSANDSIKEVIFE